MTTLEITEPAPVDFVGAAQMQDAAFALTNWMKMTPSVMCGCRRTWMRPNNYGQPCGVCLAEIYHAEQWEAAGEAEDFELLENAPRNPEFWDTRTNEAWERSGQKMPRWEMVD